MADNRKTNRGRDEIRSAQSAGSPERNYLKTAHLDDEIVPRSIRAGAVTLTAQGIKVIAQLVAIVCLARLLAPTDFGTFAMVAAVVTVLELFKDMGLSAATIQRPEITDRQASSVFWLNVALGIAAALGISALAPALAAFYGEPILAEITPVIGCAFVLTGLATQHLALPQRQMHFTSVAAVQAGSEIVALATAVAAAWVGCGLWSLVIQRLTWSAAIAGGAWMRCDWRPGRPGPLAEVRSLIKFGGNATGAMVVGHVAASLDKVLIGWWWGASALGLFERAQKILMIPIQNLNTPLGMVAIPALSRLLDQPERYRRSYVSAVTRLTMLIAPAGGLLIAASDLVAELVLGPQWIGTAPILTWMGVAAIYMPVTYSFSWLYISQDRTPEMLRAGLLNAALIIVSLAAGLPYGPTGVAAAYAISGAAVRLPALAWLVGRTGPVRAVDFLKILGLPVAAAGAAIGAALAVRMWLPIGTISRLSEAALVMSAAVGAVVITYALFPATRKILLGLPRALSVFRRREAHA